MAVLIFSFLILLKKKRPVLLDGEDASLAAFGAMVSGWPGVVIYFPLALLLMIFWHSGQMLISKIFKKEVVSERIPIGPFIFIAAFVTLFFSSYILKYLGLDVLIVSRSAGM